ncbi:MAG: hypothetical protein IPM74_01315 [Crocinitomicaceae bacterium]|nr:hypothetical protein [Crocinitomicaceae bacterium]MBK8924556.1 hypothetical protein [Crocinitomicaceae bacterium]
MKKQLTDKEKEAKKRGRKMNIALIVFLIIATPAIWFATFGFAHESVISYKHVVINGDTVCVTLSNKTSSSSSHVSSSKEHSENTGTFNHGYFIEVYDSAKNISHDKIKFDSPVSSMERQPEIFAYPDGTIWVVSTCQYSHDGDEGFILKYAFENRKIVSKDFTLLEGYQPASTHENMVILRSKNEMLIGFNPIFGNIYLDMETGEIVDERISTE